MKLRHAEVQPYRLPLSRPLATSRGLVRERCGALLHVQEEGGQRGVGEAAPLAGFGGEPLEETLAELERFAASLPGRSIDEAEAVAREFARRAPAAFAAAETAAADLRSRDAGLPLAAWLGAKRSVRAVPVNALLAVEPGAAWIPAARAAIALGFRTLKLKLGIRPWPEEIRRVRELRTALEPGIALRIDVNGAWPETEARRALGELGGLGVEFVEQPVAAEAIDAMARLRKEAPVPIAADESVRGADSARRLLDAGAADVLILKPSWLGGPRETLRIAELARDEDIDVVVTSALDGAIGRAAALHLAAAVASPYAAGLATGGLFRADLAELAAPSRGRLALPSGPGLGVRP